MGLRGPLTHTIVVSLGFTEDQRRSIGQAAVEFIVSRTKRGLGIDGVKLQGPDGDGKYSKSYKDSNEFKAGGKSGSRVNLTLTGDMLTSMDVVDVSRDGIIILGFTDDDDNDKASFMQEKNYNFFGLSEREKRKILERFGQPSNIPDIDQGLVRSFLRRALGS